MTRFAQFRTMLFCWLWVLWPFLAVAQDKSKELVPWSPGYLDIHHINTGHGDAAFMILPDGTTMLFDAGDMDDRGFNRRLAPLKSTPLKPNDSKDAAGWIAHYIRQVNPQKGETGIDYGLISHYHGDHYGNITPKSPWSEKGKYRLSGITGVHEEIPIAHIIDRASSDLNYPVDLRQYYADNHTFKNYLDFIEDQQSKGRLEASSLEVGSRAQVVLKKSPRQYPDFYVTGIKSNGTIWTGTGTETRVLFSKDSVLNSKGRFNENPLSLGIKITYGDFEYFTGGDMTGLQGYGLPQWFNVESAVAGVIGETDVTTMNHHGNRDAMNQDFIEALSPRVVVQQSWCSDHPGQEVLHRLNYYAQPTDVFATNMHAETQTTLGFWLKENYRSYAGHILVRVKPGGGTYEVIILDDTRTELEVVNRYGPYESN